MSILKDANEGFNILKYRNHAFTYIYIYIYIQTCTNKGIAKFTKECAHLLCTDTLRVHAQQNTGALPSLGPPPFIIK